MKVKKHCSRLLVLIYLFTLLIPMNTVKAAEDYVKATKTVDMAKMTTEQEATVTLTVKGAPPVSEVKPNDVILIIDKSGSMANGFEGCNYYKMDAARTSAQTFLDVMDMTKHQVGIVDFSSTSVTKELPLTHDKDSLKSYIGGIKEGGGTCTADAVRRATRMLANHRPEAQPVIIIMTDGGANDDGGSALAAFNNAKQAAKEAKDAGIVFYTLALLHQDVIDDTSEASKVMKEMATTKEHHYFAYSSGQLEEKYRAIEQQIKKPSIYNVKVKDVVSPEFEIVPGSADSNIPKPTIVGNEISWNLTEIKDDTLNFTYKIRPKKDIVVGSYKVASETYATYKDYTNADRKFDVVNPSIEVGYPAPIINTIEANNGEIAGGNEVTIKGAKFRLGANVTFGTVKATKVTLVSENEIKVTVPAGARGTVAVKVTNTDGKFGEVQYRYFADPLITSVEPNQGPIAGNTIVIIKGSNFYNGVKVKFGNKDALNTIYKNPTLLYTMSPQGDVSGNVDITITNEDGSKVVKVNAFTYDGMPKPSIKAITPSSGLLDAGNTVLITGSEFKQGATVKIGAVDGENVTFKDSTTISVKIPKCTKPGAVDVVVANPDGQSVTLAGGYTYNEPPKPAAPTVTTLSPNSGLVTGGDLVTINGTGFQIGSKVTIGDIEANIVNFYGETSLRIKIPQTTKVGIVDVKVTNPDVQSGILAAGYTYIKLPEPSIKAITPNSGLLDAGNTVLITGSEFKQGATVKIGAVDGENVTFKDSTTISVKIPKCTKPGAVDVVVANPDGQSVTLAGGYTYNEPPKPAAPTVTTLSPNSGLVTGGDLVTINGTGFQIGSKVTIGDIEANIVNFYGENKMRITIPQASKVGAVDVKVTNPDGQSVTLAGGYIYNEPPKPAAPTVTTLLPNSGLVTGGDLVTINGTGFQIGSKVTIGDIEANIVNFYGENKIRITIPQASKAGVVDVKVTNLDGQSGILAAAYTYLKLPEPSIIAITPNSGLLDAENTVLITGSEFKQGVTVKIGGVDGENVTFKDSTAISVKIPKSLKVGAVDVVVTNPDGQSVALAGGYTYNEPPKPAAPTITSLSQNNGMLAGGDLVVIIGTDFQQGLKLTIGGIEAKINMIYGATKFRVIIPAGENSGTKDVIVTNPDGQSFTLIGAYTYNEPPKIAAPTITSISQNSGLIKGGDLVIINGTGFQPGLKVTIGGIEANIANFYGATRFRILMPMGEKPGTTDVVVTNPDGQSVTLTGGYTYNEPPKLAAPTITSLSQNSGLIKGGELVTINGTGFQPGLKVTIGGIEVNIANFYGATRFRILMPATINEGSVDVEVVNPDGQKATSNAAYTYIIPELEVNSLSITSGDISGKYALSLYGKNFENDLVVTVDGIPVNVTFMNSGYIRIVSMPEGKAPGVVTIVVTNNSTGKTSSINFTYNPKPELPVCVLTGLKVASGPTAGGQYMYIYGENFTANMKLIIDGKQVPLMNYFSTTYVRASSPAHAAGTVNISVINEEGKVSNSIQYEYK
ncbi:IPT/TIG domain-containing protein [Clostridium sp. CF012]|uniref:IPT/TIG domain-containing protein n=1 Tax=Clostridium sp. CF012 TaxID=2843319 RepID=UPI001C0BBABE|nr:IPT/TIG domain-containing protein [Clostridium sp. CF012]MBU3142339.1 IPT/TIG domain-containing protein [Clostridium sp. CF012]